MDDKNIDKWLIETCDMWSHSSFFGKIIMIFACVGATSSLASLSETFIKWKGVLADMMNFYDIYIYVGTS